MINIIYSK